MDADAYSIAALHLAAANQGSDIGDIIAAMLLHTLHCKWEPDETQKQKLIDILSQRPGLDREQANNLQIAACFILHFYVSDGFTRLLKQSKDRFSDAQKDAIVELMTEFAHIEGMPNDRQKELIEQTIQTLR